MVFVISGFHRTCRTPSTSWKKLLRTTNKRHDLVLLHLRDRHEEQLPALGLLTLEDPETGEVIEIDTGSKGVRDSFAILARERMEQFRRASRQANVDTLELRTGEPYAHALFTFFQNRY